MNTSFFGRLTKDAETKTSQGGTQYTTFPISSRAVGSGFLQGVYSSMSPPSVAWGKPSQGTLQKARALLYMAKFAT